MTHFTETIKTRNQVLIGSFNNLETIKEVRRLLELGCIPNELKSTYGRIIQEDDKYLLYAYDKQI